MTAIAVAPTSGESALSAPGGALHAGRDLDESALAALEFLGQRHSVGPKHLTEPAPDLRALQRAAGLALRAPDHRRLRSFRFIVVPEATRPRLAELFAQDAARRGHGTAEVERARERAWNGPALVALIGRVQANVEDVPDSEQWVCIGAGLMNFMNALHLMGFGAKVLSGASVRDDGIRRAFRAEGESVVAWIVAGTPHARPTPKVINDPEGTVTVWDGAGDARTWGAFNSAAALPAWRLLLDWWALHRSIRAEDAAIPGPGPKDHPAGFALVKELAGVDGHAFAFGMAAGRAGQYRFAHDLPVVHGATPSMVN